MVRCAVPSAAITTTPVAEATTSGVPGAATVVDAVEAGVDVVTVVGEMLDEVSGTSRSSTVSIRL